MPSLFATVTHSRLSNRTWSYNRSLWIQDMHASYLIADISEHQVKWFFMPSSHVLLVMYSSIRLSIWSATERIITKSDEWRMLCAATLRSSGQLQRYGERRAQTDLLPPRSITVTACRHCLSVIMYPIGRARCMSWRLFKYWLNMVRRLLLYRPLFWFCVDFWKILAPVH
jgi:hypothetical protein